MKLRPRKIAEEEPIVMIYMARFIHIHSSISGRKEMSETAGWDDTPGQLCIIVQLCRFWGFRMRNTIAREGGINSLIGGRCYESRPIEQKKRG
jgi:hypothetical protein